MSVRSSILDIIAHVRGLINDASGTVFTDVEIESVLDRRRSDWTYLQLKAVGTIAPGGSVSYKDFWADRGYWEDDAELVDAGYAVLTPLVSDYINGHWTMSSQPLTPVLISGRTHDIYAGAAELLEMWAAKVALEFDFSAGGQNFSRSQQQAQLLKLAAQYRAKAPVGWAKLVREDVN